MRAARRLRPLLAAPLTSPRTRDTRRALHELGRRLRRAGAPQAPLLARPIPTRGGPAATPDLCTWGRDRLWLVETEIARRSA